MGDLAGAESGVETTQEPDTARTFSTASLTAAKNALRIASNAEVSTSHGPCQQAPNAGQSAVPFRGARRYLFAMDENANRNPAAANRKFKVKYDDMSARYASQVILNANVDEVFLDFSSGAIADPATGEPLVPVHTRIAMSPAGAKRLADLLNQALSRLA